MKRFLWLIFMLNAVVFSAQAAVDVYEFNDDAQLHRYQTLIDEMRCPKCQNQNLAGSDSPIAKDLRREIHRMLLDDMSDEQIKDFMVARYGDYVLYKPRLSGATAVLWGLPIALLLTGLVIVSLILFVRRRKPLPAAESSQDQQRLQTLLAQASERDAPADDAG